MELDAALDFIRPRQNGVLSTVKRDGRPQLSNITYHLGDDGVVRISVTDGRAKTTNIRRDNRVSLYVSQEDFWAYVVVEADAELSPVSAAPDDATVEELVEYYRALAGEHPDWDDYRRVMVSDRRLIVRLRPTRGVRNARRIATPRRCWPFAAAPAGSARAVHRFASDRQHARNTCTPLCRIQRTPIERSIEWTVEASHGC